MIRSFKLCNFPLFTDSNGHIIPGLFEYMAEGIIPLLHCFYTSFFNPQQAGSSAQRDMEYQVSILITKSLAVCLLLLVFHNYYFTWWHLAIEQRALEVFVYWYQTCNLWRYLVKTVGTWQNTDWIWRWQICNIFSCTSVICWFSSSNKETRGHSDTLSNTGFSIKCSNDFFTVLNSK